MTRLYFTRILRYFSNAMYKYVIFIIATGFIYESVSWCVRIYKSISWIKKHRFVSNKMVGSHGKIYILIPVLYEADILEDTINYFSENFLEKLDDIVLVIVTTEKEKSITGSGSNTIDVAENLASKYHKITRIHFPERNGKMAHQLNYAVRRLIDDGDLINGNDLIAFYNADSRPEKETFDWVQEKFKEGTYSVFQQYGCYLENISYIDHVSWSSALLSGSLWQTRWAIGFEIYNAIKQLKFMRKSKVFNLNYPLNYCIGHGLFITRDLFEKIGGFNEKTHNEDANMGLQLSDLQEVIMPIPYFDISESPDTLRMLYRQKSNWYFGPLQSYSCMALILERSHYGIFRKMRLIILSTKLFSHAVFWIMGPTLMLLSLFLSAIYHNVQLLVFSLLASVLFAIPSIISYAFVYKLKILPPSISIAKISGKLIRGFFVCYMMHGLSAFNGLYRYIKQILSGRNADKIKTTIHRTTF